jgi:hypothetical protein
MANYAVWWCCFLRNIWTCSQQLSHSPEKHQYITSTAQNCSMVYWVGRQWITEVFWEYNWSWYELTVAVAMSWSATLSKQMYHVSETFWSLHSNCTSILSYQQMAGICSSVCLSLTKEKSTHIQRVFNFVDHFKALCFTALAARLIWILPMNQRAWWPMFGMKG